MGDPYTECAGFMTFGPGSTYGEEGLGAEGAYMFLTWVGIVVHGLRAARVDGRMRTGACSPTHRHAWAGDPHKRRRKKPKNRS